MPHVQGVDTQGSALVEAARTAAVSGLGRVLVGVDFREGGRLALERASRLPFAPGGGIELIHVLEEGESYGPAYLQINEERDDLLDVRRPLPDAIHVSIAYGAPAAAIVDRAHHARAELVALGRHRVTDLGDRLLGTTAERVVASGNVSVLLVARPATSPYRTALVAVDLSESSLAALVLAMRVCQPEGVHVLHVVSRGDELARGHEALTTALGSIGAGQVSDMVVEVGDPGAVILRAAWARGADLIAIGTRGRGRIQRWIAGSVAEIIMREAASDVLVTR